MREQHPGFPNSEIQILINLYGSPADMVRAMAITVNALTASATDLRISPKERAAKALEKRGLLRESPLLESDLALVEMLRDTAMRDPVYRDTIGELVPAWKAYLERYSLQGQPRSRPTNGAVRK